MKKKQSPFCFFFFCFLKVSFRKMFMKMKWKTLVSFVPEGVLGNVQSRRSTNNHIAAAA